MSPDTTCPSLDVLRRSLDADDPMTEPERRRIAAHVDGCQRGCRAVIDALLRGATRAPATPVPAAPDPEPPERLGRYQVLGRLGAGGMGVVYRGYDQDLGRAVAIKVPHRNCLSSPQDIQGYLDEGLHLAGLDHPAIVPVYDVGQTGDGLCYLVSKFIDGTDLAKRIHQARPAPDEAAQIIIRVAGALHHAHKQGLVHRDVKPANILLDGKGAPFLTDFGLALREEDYGRGPNMVGTPAYMSPEQARGEGHRVDARTDIYSLGVVLYQLLCGRLPFPAGSLSELLDQIQNREPRPPRTIDDTISRELERICLKAISKRITDRYTTALDLAEELRSAQGGRGTTSLPAPSPAALGQEEVDRLRRGVAPGGTVTLMFTDIVLSSSIKLLLGGSEGERNEAWVRQFQAPHHALIRACLQEFRGYEVKTIGDAFFAGFADAVRAARCAVEIQRRLASAALATPLADHPRLQVRIGLHTGTPFLQSSDYVGTSADKAARIEAAAAGGQVLVSEQTFALLKGQLPDLAFHEHGGFELRGLGEHRLVEILWQGKPPQRPGASSPPKGGRVVPRGLRSFGPEDADFFLELLPGPCDRNGLPESIRFWKTRIEAHDVDRTFGVGLLYGPSGCGKSSLVKAALLPRLSDTVLPVYVEATADQTEARLLRELAKHCPGLPAGLSLPEAVATLRRGQGLPSGKKVTLVLDQFEQWLHARGEEPSPALVQALRQCDGSHVQALLLVRDDFWMAVTRLMRELEVPLVEGHNCVAVDLFDAQHARKVLAAFGRAFGKLPEAEPAPDQERFLDRAVAELAQEGRVISVRLSLFAEMVKGRPWTPATLKEVGGAEGLGVTFLEETFSAATAPPHHRLHQKAARALLKALLPEQGTDIKGNIQSQAKLLEVCGYRHRPRDFEDLLRILDSEVRLITPTQAPEGDSPDEQAAAALAERYYQLTHDYLVHSLRAWLTRKQKETQRGRAELRLAERAAAWQSRPENRHLPAWWEWLNIRLLTRKKDWTSPQRKMMRKAARFHGCRVLLLAVCLALLGWAGWQGFGTLQAQALRDRLLDAATGDVPAIVADMAPYRRWVNPLLKAAYAQAEASHDDRTQLHASLALLPVDPGQVKYLYGRLLNAEPQEVEVIIKELSETGHLGKLTDSLWKVVEQPPKGQESQRLRAASALARFDPDNSRWEQAGGPVVEQLVSVNPIVVGPWMKGLRPVKTMLLAPLAGVFRDRMEERTGERSLATSILADFAADQPQLLDDLLLDGDEKQFAVIYPKLKERGEQALPLLTGEIDKKLPSDLPSSDENREKLAKRQANAAVALLRMGQPQQVWPLLKRSNEPDDPRARSYLIHYLSPLGADAGAIVKRLDEEPDITIRRALLLSLGEFDEKALPPEARQALLPRFQGIYATDSDPGLHAAAEWLLRTWQREAWLKQVNDRWAKDKGQQEKWLDRIQQEVRKQKDKTPQWYVNGQGQTMVVIPGPVEFLMGSPSTEAGRSENELRHKERIGRTFAVAAKPVTMEQFQRYYRAVFKQDYDAEKRYTPTGQCPVNYTSWYQAAAYCNWLSDQEGLDRCYEMNPQGGVTKLKENYLSLTGYRLPTEAEWEYACRAGAVTSRYYGETEELLAKYGWYVQNGKERTWPVGSKKPNDLGLFDLHGNVWCWCQERYEDYSRPKDDEAVEDKEDISDIVTTYSRVLRGGSFGNHAVSVRSANRIGYVPSDRNSMLVGFRPARTFH